MSWSVVYILANSGCAALLFKTSCVCVCGQWESSEWWTCVKSTFSLC